MKSVNEITVTDTAYFKLTRTCDNLICRPDAPSSIVAIPWLHVINEVPFMLSVYSDVLPVVETQNHKIPQSNPFISVRDQNRGAVFYFAQFVKSFIRSFYFRDSRLITASAPEKPFLPDLDMTRVDVLIVTWLLNRDHLEKISDFYFGELQQLLLNRGLSSLLLMRNQSGYHSHELQQQTLRKGSTGRLLLPDTQSPGAELGYLRKGLELRRYFRKHRFEGYSEFEKRLFQKASEFSVLSPGIQNLRLHDQIEIICRRFEPSIVVTLYEGHAWERCVWHAAREANPETLCVGYQHTILRKHSHALRRSLHPLRKGYDPNLILTLGSVTQKMLEKSMQLPNISKMIYGTHRRFNSRIKFEEPKSTTTFLVLPEGVESESMYLFNIALACAPHLPDVRFIFRMHPVLLFDDVRPLLKGYPPKTGNVEVSDNPDPEEDFARSGYILYRGSSTVIYAILAGLKPYYFERPNEMNFDPIFELTVWRERVRSTDELIRKFKADQKTSPDLRSRQWTEALTYCDQYTRSVREETLDWMIAHSVSN
ncbi:MAG: hypothetical protein QF876_10515 [Desulfobacterales bacterium]|jgi:hypothetical protein|nr:hypothetical protein [Desulfobacterales bacterium]MDP6808189.1 hypothetical protein [Desulfobacterales bacterium]|tara:strand:+ start:37814 stop:39427 length:1614 start_codon:yes stop_codon:yes gene_type:complete